MSEFISSTADVRGDYRYSLTRIWDDSLPVLTFVLLNPSTADATQSDPTLRRCIGFAKRENCGGLRIVNLYAYRATSPKEMLLAADPVGPDNDRILSEVTGKVVAGWGTSASQGRVMKAISLLPQLYALGVTKGGQPKHPLYIKGDAPLVEWP